MTTVPWRLQGLAVGPAGEKSASRYDVTLTPAATLRGDQLSIRVGELAIVDGGANRVSGELKANVAFAAKTLAGELTLAAELPALPHSDGTFGPLRAKLDMAFHNVTPRIMATVEDTRGVVDELRQRMGNVEKILPGVGTRELPTSGDARKELQTQRNAEKIPLEFNQSLKVSPNTVQ